VLRPSEATVTATNPQTPSSPFQLTLSVDPFSTPRQSTLAARAAAGATSPCNKRILSNSGRAAAGATRRGRCVRHCVRCRLTPARGAVAAAAIGCARQKRPARSSGRRGCALGTASSHQPALLCPPWAPQGLEGNSLRAQQHSDCRASAPSGQPQSFPFAFSVWSCRIPGPLLTH
jgi:hypothetical protein